MKFTVDKHEKYVLIKLNENKLNSLISPQLKSELILCNSEGQRNIILDLSNIKYSDSSGLSSLLVGHRICKNADGIFILTRINENIARQIQIQLHQPQLKGGRKDFNREMSSVVGGRKI